MKYYWIGWKEEGKIKYMERLSTKEIELQTGPNPAFINREDAQSVIENSPDEDRADLVIHDSETDDYDYGV